MVISTSLDVFFSASFHSKPENLNMTSPLPPLEPTIAQLRSLSNDTLLYELNRLENSNKHLLRSNQDMKEHDAHDQELQMYVTENEKIIGR